MSQLVKIATLVEDNHIYPRFQLNEDNVTRIIRGFEAGAAFPPIVVDKKTRILIDGRTRVHAAWKFGVDRLPADLRTFKNKADMLEAAIALNQHGRQLSSYDQAHCFLLAKKVGLPEVRVAAALCMTHKHLGELAARKTGYTRGGVQIPLKRTVAHLAGGKLTKKQVEGNRLATGPFPVVSVNQVINLLENDLVDKNNQPLHERLEILRDLLIAYLP